MQKEIVFWTAFAAVMLGIVITLVRNYRRARAREIALEDLHRKVLADAASAKAAAAAMEPAVPVAAVPSPEVPVSARSREAKPSPQAGPAGMLPIAESLPEAFDPTKTRLFVRADSVPTGPAGALGGIPWLICLGGRQKGLRFSIPALGLSVGRADDNDVVIIDGRVSAHHAWIGMVGGQPMLRDYQSLNGTFINEKLDVAVSEAALGHGDIIQFGGAGGDQYRFVIE